MDFDLSSDHRAFRSTVRSFAEKNLNPVVHDLDEKEEFSVGLTKLEKIKGVGKTATFQIVKSFNKGVIPG